MTGVDLMIVSIDTGVAVFGVSTGSIFVTTTDDGVYIDIGG